MDVFYCCRCVQKFEVDSVSNLGYKITVCPSCGEELDLSKIPIYHDQVNQNETTNKKEKEQTIESPTPAFSVMCFYFSIWSGVIGIFLSIYLKSWIVFSLCLSGSFVFLFCGNVIKLLQRIVDCLSSTATTNTSTPTTTPTTTPQNKS